MQEIKFGTGGWRAVIGEDFTQKNVRRVAEGISLLLHEKDKKHTLCKGGIHVYHRRIR